MFFSRICKTKRVLLSNNQVLIWKLRMSSVTSGVQVQLRASSVELKLNNQHNSRPLLLDYFWLRDHCRCSMCFNQTTHQRNLKPINIPETIAPEKYKVDSDMLDIEWNDGHKSSYQLLWLTKFCEPEQQFLGLQSFYNARILWKSGEPPVVPHIQFAEITKATATIADALLKYGVVCVHQVPPTLEDTEKVVNIIGPVQTTFFGSMWQFGPDLALEQHEDTAYTREALDPHTDGTYFSEPSGLQIFHCLNRSKNLTGGETLLVDGMAAAHALKHEYPHSYNILSSIAIEAEYQENLKHYLAKNPIIVTDPVSNDILQIRFNLYDRAPMRTIQSSENIRIYYKALCDLTNIILSDRFLLKMKLEPGTVLIVDNWRILHGRTAFKGHRHMCGAYIARSDWISLARTMGLLF